MNQEQENQTRAEWTKFGVLSGILFVVVLVVALVRPLIFGQIVPLVMGEGLTLPTPSSAELPTKTPTEIPEGTAVPSATEPVANPAPADPTATPTVHVVQPGETINAIARQYNVGTADIIARNNLTNPNLIKAGDILIIPTP